MNNADDIRRDCKAGFGSPVSSEMSAVVYFLGEIAAQLAEINERLRTVTEPGEKCVQVMSNLP